MENSITVAPTGLKIVLSGPFASCDCAFGELAVVAVGPALVSPGVGVTPGVGVGPGFKIVPPGAPAPGFGCIGGAAVAAGVGTGGGGVAGAVVGCGWAVGVGGAWVGIGDGNGKGSVGVGEVANGIGNAARAVFGATEATARDTNKSKLAREISIPQCLTFVRRLRTFSNPPCPEIE